MSDESSGSDTLYRYFLLLEATNPAAMRVFVAEDEDEFILAVEHSLDAAIVSLESGGKMLTAFDEPTLSWMLVICLAAAGIGASAETYHNGHVDVLIKHPLLSLACIGECKLHKGYEYHVGGCKQLLDRYCSGRAKRGFCLDFFKVAGIYEKLGVLRKDFRDKKPLRQQGEPVVHGTIKGAFVSKHAHTAGSLVEILHLGCNCYHSEAKTTGNADSASEPAGLQTRGR